MVLEHSHDPTSIAQRLDGSFRHSYVRDLVYGGIDGAITTFAIVAGVVGAALSPNIILILGFANLLADGFSMAASNYSGTKAVTDNVERIRKIEARHIRLNPEGEREEVRQLLAKSGLEGPVLDEAVRSVIADEHRWIDYMVTEEYGLALANPSPLRAGLYTFLAFAICGAVPLLPFLIATQHALVIAMVMTGIVFFAIGAMKSRWAIMSWWRSGLETFIIGTAAAGLAFSVGYALRSVWNVGL